MENIAYMEDENSLSSFILSCWDENHMELIGLIKIGKLTHLMQVA